MQPIQAYVEGLCPTHRESCDSSSVAVFRHSIGLLHLRDDFSEEGITKFLEVPLAEVGIAKRREASGDDLRGAIAEGHDDQHGLSFPLHDQVVKNHVSASDSRPSAGVIAEAMQEVEHWVQLPGFGIIAGRGVDVDPAAEQDRVRACIAFVLITVTGSY